MSKAKLLGGMCLAVVWTAVGWFTGSVGAADWKPADGPLMTRWAKDVKPDKAWPDYPRPQLRRDAWLNLNGLWQFATAKEDEAPPVGKELDGRILVPYPVESALSGVIKPADRVWYRRTFVVPKEWAGQRVLLHFGAVNWESTVWLNGKKIADHRGGYDPFTIDLTGALDAAKAEQELIVWVRNPLDAGTQPRGKQVKKPGGIFYTASTGIWQTVWLEPVAPQADILWLKIIPDADGGKVRIGMGIRGAADGLTVRFSIKDGDKTVAAADQDLGAASVFAIDKPKLWSPEHPFLYDLHVELRQKGKRIDAVDSYFGMRKIEVSQPTEKGTPRILLNGEPIFLRGPLDQGFWPDGIYTAPTDEALKYDIEITKKIGFNMTRKHVKVEPDRWYYWCDKLGLLVFQDMPSGDKSIGADQPDVVRTPESAKEYDRELNNIIDVLYNHPSIMMWVVFNEGWGQFDTKRVTEWTKQYDPSRLVDDASGWADRKVGDVIDMHSYPGPNSPESDGKRALVLGEFGGLGLQIDGHTWEKKIWGYKGVKDPADLTRQYEKLWQGVYKLKDEKGLSAAVYTQLTDVETEGNGLLTYDRAVIKPDLKRAAAAAQGDFSNVPKETTAAPEQPPTPAFRKDYFGKMPRAWVEILKIDPERRVLTVRTKKGEEREVALRGDTEMRVRDSWGDLSDLYPGESVMLFVYHDDAGDWSYPRAVQDEIQMMSAHKWWWTVEALDAGTVALVRTDDKGKEVKEAFRVGESTKVWKGERPAGPDALKVGDVVLFQTRYEDGRPKRFAVEFFDEKGLAAVRASQQAKHAKALAAAGLPAVVNDIDLLNGAVRATVQWEAAEEARSLKPGGEVELTRPQGKMATATVVENKPEGSRERLLLSLDPAEASPLHVGDEVRVFPKAAK